MAVSVLFFLKAVTDILGALTLAHPLTIASPSSSGNQGAFQAQTTRGQQAQAASVDEGLYTEEEPVMPPHRGEAAPAGKAGKAFMQHSLCQHLQTCRGLRMNVACANSAAASIHTRS